MLEHKFTAGLKRLEQNLTTADRTVAYKQEQKDILWGEFKTLNSEAWEKLIGKLIRKYSYLPKTSQLHDTLEEIEKEMGGHKIKRDIRRVDVPCNICDREGLRHGLFRREDRPDQIAVAIARCHCENAENWNDHIPLASDIERNPAPGFLGFAEPHRVESTKDALEKTIARGDEPEPVGGKGISDDEVPF